MLKRSWLCKLVHRMIDQRRPAHGELAGQAERTEKCILRVHQTSAQAADGLFRQNGRATRDEQGDPVCPRQ